MSLVVNRSSILFIKIFFKSVKGYTYPRKKIKVHSRAKNIAYTLYDSDIDKYIENILGGGGAIPGVGNTC